MSSRTPILVASHPRSGTHLVIDTIRRHFPVTRARRLWGKPVDHLYLNVERLTAGNRRFDDRTAHRILGKSARPLMKTHYSADFAETWCESETGPLAKKWREMLSTARVIYVFRDPRHVMVSYHQFLSPIDASVRGMTLGEFIRSEHWTGSCSKLEWWARHVRGWLHKPGILPLNYDDLLNDASAAIERLAAHLDEVPVLSQPLLPPKVSSILRARVNRLVSLSPSSTAIVADRRRFPARVWDRHATDDDEKYLQTVTDGLFETLPVHRS